MNKTALLLVAALASPSAAAPLACGDGQIEAVEHITRYEEDLMRSAPEQPSLIFETTTYFGVDGSTYSHERGKRLFPDRDPAAEGVVHEWLEYDSEHWLVEDDVYFRLRSPDGETLSLRPRLVGPFDPDVAIEEIPPGAPHTAERSGVRCRFRRTTDANGGVTTLCRLNVYGRELSIEASRTEDAGRNRAERTLSLTRLCIDRSLLAPPDLDWAEDRFIARP